MTNEEVTNDLYIWKRSINDSNTQKFTDLISNQNWDDIYDTINAQDAFSKLHSKLKFLYDEAFPKRKIKIRYYNKKPWLSEELKESIKWKNKLYTKSKKYPSAFNETTYKTYRNNLNKKLIKAEKDYYNELIILNKNNIKRTWHAPFKVPHLFIPTPSSLLENGT